MGDIAMEKGKPFFKEKELASDGVWKSESLVGNQ